MPRLLLLISLGFTLPNLALGAPIDLGQNLTYVRLHGHPDDGPTLAAAWGKPALIVDLRYPAADAARFFSANLPSRPSPAPLFVLVGPGTPSNALAALRERAPALITLGLSASGLTPDIALAVKPDEDRRAYEALDSGVPVESLLSEKISKQRFDEAALVHERSEDSAGPAKTKAASAASNEKPAQTPEHTAVAAPPAEPGDPVLQRAVQLHRTLLALRKLPRN